VKGLARELQSLSLLAAPNFALVPHEEKTAMNNLSLSVISFAAVGVFALSPVSAKATALGQAAHYTANQTAKPAAPVDDSTLTDRIEKWLEADATLKKFDIDVSVKDHVATLTGKVQTEAQKTRAAREAHVTGVTRVDNQLTLDKDAGKTVAQKVKGAADTAGNKTHAATDTAVDKSKGATDTAADKTKSATHTAADKTKSATDTAVDKTKSATNTAADKTKSATNTAADKTKSATNTAADKSKDAVSETGEAITDSWITTKVHAGFTGEDLLKGSDINVDTNNHVVTLKGTVKSDAGRARAVQIAKTTKGVTKVVDDLKISSK